MEIKISRKRLAKVLNSSKEIRKKYGESAPRIQNRLYQIWSAKNLEELMRLPGNHHPLKGDRSGYFACSLKHPLRLVYRPANEPLPLDEDNSIVYSRVTIIEIVEIIDYH